jgi:hypothetical protein
MRRHKKMILALALFGGAVAALATGAIGLPSSVVRPSTNAGGCRIFPANNPWNQRIDRAPVARRSGRFVGELGLGESLMADFSIPYATVSGSQPKVRVSFENRRESDRGPYPIPPNAPVEGGTPDKHVIVLERDNCRLYELYNAHPINGGARWAAGSGATWNLRSNHLRPRGWTSADAAGLPILPGLARYDEVKRGKIDHALRFTAYNIRWNYVYPARHSDGDSGSADAPPMGTRFRLRRGFDTSRFPPQSKVILKALKRYGMILADTGAPIQVSGAPSGGWNDGDLESLTRVKGRDFEAVDTGRLPTPGR